jgi:hypothetical protein
MMLIHNGFQKRLTQISLPFFSCLIGLNFGCGQRADSRSYQVPLLDFQKMSALTPYRDQPVSLAAISDDCIQSGYRFTVTDATGQVLIDETDVVVPDFSALSNVAGTPTLDTIVSAFSVRKEFSLPSVEGNSSLEAVTISFRGVAKLCDEIWGGGGKISTLTTQFYGESVVNLVNPPGDSHRLCQGAASCIRLQSFASPMYAAKTNADLTDFIDNEEKYNFIPIRFNHQGTECLDDASEKASRNQISIFTQLGVLAENLETLFYGSDASPYAFKFEDTEPVILTSVLLGQAYQVRFTQGRGTGCTPARSTDLEVKVERDEVFDSAQNRLLSVVDRTVTWAD